MKRYLVYYDKTAIGGIDAIDSQSALHKARIVSLKGDRKHIRVRLAKPNTLLWHLANQSNYR